MNEITAWAEQLLAVMMKPFRRHSKGLSALTALIGSLMKSPTMYLTGTNGGPPVCTSNTPQGEILVREGTVKGIISRVHI